MKKAFALFFAVLYLAVSSGLAVEIHHCMGKIADFSFHISESKTCGSCGMPKSSKTCCKDELKFVKIQDTYKLSNVNYELNVPEADFTGNHYLVNENVIDEISVFNGKDHSPPGYSSSSLYLLNCVFRI